MKNAAMKRQEADAFARFWADLFKAFPESRRKAVEAMGQTVKQDLDKQIQAAQLDHDAKGTVQAWQEVRLGSRGGYAAISPRRDVARPKAGEKQHTWQGNAVTQRQVTRWLERGHGTPSTGAMTWSYQRKTKTLRRIRERAGTGYVRGRLFYSWTKLDAWEHARKTAERLLSAIADEVDY